MPSLGYLGAAHLASTPLSAQYAATIGVAVVLIVGSIAVMGAVVMLLRQGNRVNEQRAALADLEVDRELGAFIYGQLLLFRDPETEQDVDLEASADSEPSPHIEPSTDSEPNTARFEGELVIVGATSFGIEVHRQNGSQFDLISELPWLLVKSIRVAAVPTPDSPARQSIKIQSLHQVIAVIPYSLRDITVENVNPHEAVATLLHQQPLAE